MGQAERKVNLRPLNLMRIMPPEEVQTGCICFFGPQCLHCGYFVWQEIMSLLYKMEERMKPPGAGAQDCHERLTGGDER